MSISKHHYEDNTGFISLEGDDIKNGQIDIQSARYIIEGTQFALDYMLKNEESSLRVSEGVNYPISVREGCWEVLVPFGAFLVGTASTAFAKGANTYAETTAKMLAEKQFAKKESKEVFESAFKKLGVVIKITQHLGVVDRKQPLDTKIVDYQKKSVLLTNRQGNVMSTTLDEIDIYLSCPENLLRSLASVVTDYRTLSIGYKKDGVLHASVIDRDTREIFAPEDEPQSPILPELQNGQHITLAGYVSRGNQNTRTIGFQYNGHTITCEPKSGQISDYLNAHYKNCEISGFVVRTSPEEVELGKRDRPKIIFDNLIVLGNKHIETQTAFEGLA